MGLHRQTGTSETKRAPYVSSYPGHSGYDRKKFDYYREPGWSVDYLLKRETFIGSAFDPFCGGFTIPARCRAYGIKADGSDIQSIAGCQVEDFFTSTSKHDNIISNPPYRKAMPALLHALPLAKYKVAFLLRTNFLHSVRRRAIFESGQLHLAGVLILSNRPSCPPGIYEGERDNLGCLIQPEEKGGKMDYAWFICEHGHNGPPVLDWL